MAAYTELYDLFNDSALRNKVTVACLVAAETIRNEDGATENHANRLLWAKQAWQSPKSVGEQMLMATLAGNKDLTVQQITGATDAAIQTKVDAAVNVFADGS